MSHLNLFCIFCKAETEIGRMKRQRKGKGKGKGNVLVEKTKVKKSTTSTVVPRIYKGLIQVFSRDTKSLSGVPEYFYLKQTICHSR